VPDCRKRTVARSLREIPGTEHHKIALPFTKQERPLWQTTSSERSIVYRVVDKIGAACLSLT